jgi:hypothetical protein
MHDVEIVKREMARRVEEMAAYLFPNGKREGNHWCVGDITGAPGKSFKICVAGDKAGLHIEQSYKAAALKDCKRIHALTVSWRSAAHAQCF